MIIKSILLFCVFLPLFCCSQNKEINNTIQENDSLEFYYNPKPDSILKYCLSREEKNGKIGWLNILGEWIIPAEYDKDTYYSEWREGILIVKKNNKYGAINYKNQLVIPCIYNNKPESCYSGILVIKNNNGLYAYFNKYGKQLCKFQRYELRNFENGIGIIQTEFIKPEYTTITQQKKRLENFRISYFVVNNKLDTLLSFKKSPFRVELGKQKNGFTPFYFYPRISGTDLGKQYGKFGYINQKGEMSIEIQFSLRNHRGKPELLGKTNYEITDMDCDFNSNRAKIWELDEYYYIDTLGKKVIQFNNKNIRWAYAFNDAGLGTYSIFDTIKSESIVVIFDINGKELFKENKNLHFGNKGTVRSESLNNNSLFEIWDSQFHQQTTYSNNYQPIFTIDFKDSTKNLIISPFYSKFADEIGLYGSVSIGRKGLPNQEYYDKYVISTKGIKMTSLIPAKVFIDPLAGRYAIINQSTEKSILYDFSKKIQFQCDSCYIGEYVNNNSHYINNDDFMRKSVGVYQVNYMKLSHSKEIINHKGIILNKLCDDFKGNFMNINTQIENFKMDAPVKFKFDEIYLQKVYETIIGETWKE